MLSKQLIKRGVLNISYLMIGNVFSQFIGLLAFVFIAKELGPEDYGIYSTVVAFVGMFKVLTLNGLSKVLIRNGSENYKNFKKVLETTIGTKIIFIMTSIIFVNLIVLFTNYSFKIRLLILIFSIELLAIGLESFLGSIFQVNEKMKYLAYFSVLSKITFSLLSITFIFFGYKVLSVIIANLIARFSVLFLSYYYSRQFITFKLSISWKIDKLILNSAILFTLISSVNVLARKIDLVMISFLSTPKDVGIYSIAYKASQEGEVLRNIISTAFFPIVVKSFKENQSFLSLIKPSLYLLSGIIICCTIGTYYSKDIVISLFGDLYSKSGEILRYLLFSLVFSFYTIPLTLILQTTNNEKLLLITSFIIAALNIPLNLIFFYRYGLIGIAYSTLIVYFTSALMLTLLTYKVIKVKS